MTTKVNPIHRITYDGCQLNVYTVNKGEGLPKHSHVYEHLVVCLGGELIVRMEGISGDIIMHPHSEHIVLPAYQWHEIEAAIDGTMFINAYKALSLKTEMAMQDRDD